MISDNVGINWGITFKNAPDKLVGMISFHRIEKEHYRAEIGYLLHPDYWGQGIVSEGVKALLDFGFNTLGFNSIEGHIRPQNAASRQVLLKNNFVKEATFRQNLCFEGEFLDTEVYVILKENA
jgi:ribosomal-protein-alanine N-acetyltransferase